ncbi:hypothetical protein M0R04_08125 [Candidatus Dojkabacteria bacterium]|jgi:hypothetical protein|nr:hypothetical protein [Candidatus Dojkabacteria bacterium]
MQKIDDKIWLFLNKKPNSKISNYLGIRILWVGVGIMLMVIPTFWSSDVVTLANKVLGTIAAITLIVLYLNLSMDVDKKTGITEAEYYQYLKWFKEKKEKILARQKI